MNNGRTHLQPIAQKSRAAGSPESILQTHRSGFTLIEMLVVIAVIAVMLSLLLPGLGKARAMAKRVKCTSNLRQIDLAMQMYLSSHNDTYPGAQDPVSTNPRIWLWMGRGWRSYLAPYLGGKIDANNPSVLLCPSDRTAVQKWESTSYSYSLAFYHSPEQIKDMSSDLKLLPPVALKPVNVAKPSGKIIVGEWLSNHKQIEDDNDLGWWCWAGSRNFLFADSQVRFLGAKEIRPAGDGNPNPNLTKNGIRGIDWPP
ncbi:MAG: DUF1559 domain-containing protein [Sedimentisphaerales bacterium]